MKILIVDDNLNRHKRIEAWLKQLETPPAEIAHTDNTTEARELLKQRYFDILILDVVLPAKKNSIANWSSGIELLEHINTSNRIKKPEKIIGITAYSDDIQSFKAKFEGYCLSVIEIQDNSNCWKPKLLNAFSYTASSITSRAPIKSFRIITVHGIRTFGSWQERLERIVKEKSDDVEFLTYKYGYFSTLFFLIPFIRNREISRLKAHLKPILTTDSDHELSIFCHSFGTYLVAHALKSIILDGTTPNIRRIILCGSVLKSNFNWSFASHIKKLQIINDCGDRDFVLWLSEGLVPLTGMAGKTGFYGFNNDRLVNRFFSGGHSHYFNGDNFMRTYWLPILLSNESIKCVDLREASFFSHGVLEQIIIILGKLKNYAWAASLTAIAVFSASYFV